MGYDFYICWRLCEKMIYFFVFGIIMLLILTYQDIKKLSVDSRYNWLMHGLALSLTTHYNYNIGGVLLLIFGFALIKNKLSKYIGMGDLTALHWILYGTFIINPLLCGLFGLVFAFITLIYGSIKLFFFKNVNIATPFYPVILSSFVLTGYLYVINLFN